MPRHISLAVVGADFENKKGPTRRFEIAMCVAGEPVHLVPEPRNPADRNAVAVYSSRDIQIGYVRAERAPLIGKMLRQKGVIAVFQQADAWGATIRASLDGSPPILPDFNDQNASDWPPPGSEDADWWPDEEWPE